MKKLLCLVLATLLALGTTAALADEIDNMSLEELMSLRNRIDARIIQLAKEVDRSDYSLEGLIYVSNGKEVRINTYEGTNPNLVIPATINGLPVTMIQTSAFKDNTTLVSVVIPEGVTEIPDETFSGCKNLTSVTLPSTIKKIGWWAFHDTLKLTSLQLPEGLTTLTNAAFQRAQGLSGVLVLPTTLTAKGNYTFSRCDKLTGIVVQSNLTLSNADFGYIKFVYVRKGCRVSIEDKPFDDGTLEVIILPDTVTSISDNAFDNCKKLTIVAPAGSYAEQYAMEHFIVCDTASYETMTAQYDAPYLQ